MKSLKVSIYLKVLLLIGVASIVTNIYSIVVSSGDIRDLLNNEAEQISRRTAQSLAFPFWNLDSVGVSEIIDAQMQNSNMYAITLKEQTSLKQFVPGMIKESGGTVQKIDDSFSSKSEFRFSSPILFEGEELGNVTVILTDEVLRSFLMRNQFTKSLFELFILFLLAVPLSYIIAKSFIDPVENLARAFHDVVESRFEKAVPKVAEREIMNLADIFENVRLTLLDSLALIRQNEKDLTTTLNSISDGIVATDQDCNVIRLNPIAEELVGVKSENAFGKPLKEILCVRKQNGTATDEELVDEIINSAEHGNKTSRVYLEHVHTGNECTVDISASHIMDEVGGFKGDVLVIRDITEQLKVEEELKQRRKMESLGQLSGGVAHDFNNMLGGIIGFSDLLKESLDEGSEQREYVRNILEAANSAADLTAKLLAFSRKGKMVSTPFNFHESCETATSLLSRTINKNIVISSDLSADHAYVTGDPSQIQNAILNLCINAKDAMPEGGELTLSSYNTELFEHNDYQLESGMYVVLDISDTGSGIPPEIQPKIFEPFFTTKDTGKGTGLGLAAVYGAVQNHHGTVTLKSSREDGTTFTVLLPVELDVVVDKSSQGVIEKITNLDKRILIVDDEKILRAMVDKVVSDLGGVTMQASDGVEAVALFREKHHDIDLVILDMVMPHMNGDECFHLMKGIDDTVPILLSSGFDKNTSISHLLENGAAGYIHKPFEIKELTRLLIELSGKGSDV